MWGLCKGSGGKPYQAVVDLDGGSEPGYRCSCPSRKFPCKHALGLLLLWAGGEATVAEHGQAPEWAEQWLAGRRERAARAANPVASDGSSSTEGGLDGRRQPADPEAARHRAERRARSIAVGATDLEQRLEDLLRSGLAGADQAGYTAWEEMAARMVDAQAKGLADGIRQLGGVPASGPGWPERLLSECSLLHLLARGYLGVEALPGPLASTVRRRVGLTVDTATVLADEEARLSDTWLVLAQRDTTDTTPTIRRTWLWGRDSGRYALFVSYGTQSQPPGLSLPVGTSLDADLAFYPEAWPLRAVLGERRGPLGAGFVPTSPGGTVTDALAGYARALCADPWLESWPAVLADVVPVPVGEGGWQLADAEGDAALPVAAGVAPSALWKLAAVSGGEPLTVFGDCGHRGFAPYTAWSPGEGDDTAVPL